MTQQTQKGFVTRSDQLERSGTPLRRFKGKLVDIDQKVDSNREKGYLADLNFTEMDVLESVNPYPFPSAKVTFRYRLTSTDGVSNRGAWGMFLESCANQGWADIMELKGKILEMTADPEHIYGTADDGTSITGMTWELTGVEGEGTASAISADDSHLLSLINGKTSTEFSEAALQDEIGRKPENQSRIFNNSFIANWTNSGKIVLEGETYRVV